MNSPKIFDYLWKHFSFIGNKGTGSMFYHQKVARVRVFADIQNFALRAHYVHGIPMGHQGQKELFCTMQGNQRGDGCKKNCYRMGSCGLGT